MLYDFGVPVALIWYWYTFFRDARRLAAEPHPLPGQAPVTQAQVTKGQVTHGQVTQEKPITQEKPAAPKDR
jgi:hypothetical protein